jgi:hypothetical protein
VANGWGTKHPILDIVPPLLVEEEGPPTYKKELDPEINLYRNSRGQVGLNHLSTHYRSSS